MLPPDAPAPHASATDGPLPAHLGIIPDGNRRWAERERTTKRDAYLRAAAKALEVVGWAHRCGIPRVTAFGISPENVQRRPMDELEFIHEGILAFCRAATAIPALHVTLYGDAAALPRWVPRRDGLRTLRTDDAAGRARCIVTLVVNDAPGRDSSGPVPPALDLVIRTGGQQRLSGFLPLQSAYAELWFTDRLWPDFTAADFAAALRWYAAQERRLGE